MKKIIHTMFAILGGFTVILGGLFTIYMWNLDMKLTVNGIVPILEKVYDKRERKQSI